MPDLHPQDSHGGVPPLSLFPPPPNPLSRPLLGSPQCIVGNSPSPPWGGGMWVRGAGKGWGGWTCRAGMGPGWMPHPGAGRGCSGVGGTLGCQGKGGGGRCRAAVPGRHDVRRGRELAQVDKAGENRNPRSGGRVAGRGGRLQVGTGPGWGPPAPWGRWPSRDGGPPSRRHHPGPPRLPSHLPPGSSSSSAAPARPRCRRCPTASAPPARSPHGPGSPVPPPRHPPGALPTAGGPGTPSLSPGGPGNPAPWLWWPWDTGP